MDNIENLINDIKIPEGIDLSVKKGIERGRREKRKRYSSQHKYKKIAVAATAAVFITIAAGVMNPDIVKAIPGMESIFKLVKYGNMGERFDKFEQFSTSVSKTVEKNGIKVTIDEIVIDNNSLAVTSIIEGENLKENRENMGSIRLNGKSLTSYSEKDKKIGDNKLMTITYGNVSDMELSEEVDININIVWVDDVKGPWDFKFKVSKVDKATNSKVNNLDKTIKLPSSTLKFEKLVISPLGNTINYTGVFDNLNKNEFHNTGIYSFAVMDDKGRIMETSYGNGFSNEERYEGKIEILNDLSNVKSLTVVPVLKKWGDKTKEINNFNYPILQTTINSTDLNIPQEVVTKSRAVTEKEKSHGYAMDKVIHVYNIDKVREFATLDNLVNRVIKVGENSTALIKNIEATDKETKITFKLEGSGAYSFRKINSVVILDEDFNDIQRAEDGPMALLEDVEERIVSIKLPPIDKSKKYKIALPIIEEPQIEDKYKIGIDLTK